ncbi:MAG: hypothetical protein AABN33_20125 [Acidobacteriota bacterium]
MAINSTSKADDSNGGIAARRSDASSRARATRAGEKQALAARSEITETSRGERDAGDQVNRFLLCTLVSESSKRIKASAEKAGESMPLATIVRGVLRAYRVAAADKEGPLAGPELDIVGLKRLNEKVLKGEIARHTRERVKNSEARLARAERLGDDSRIKAEKGELELAIEVRHRLAEVYR